MRTGWGLFVVVLSTPTGSAFAAESVTYKYDALGRLTTKSASGTVNNNKKVTICYDAAGNRKIYKVAANGTAAVCPAPVPTP